MINSESKFPPLAGDSRRFALRPPPLDSTGRPDKRYACRLGGAAVALICLTMFVVAACVKPDRSGLGTHRQLGQPSCGFYERTGYPCPTCGMTTAFAWFIRGHIARSFQVQPAGALLALTCLIALIAGAYLALGGRRLDISLIWMAFHGVYIVLAAVLIVLLGWGWLCLQTWLTGNK